MEKNGPDVIIIRRRAPAVADAPKNGIWKIAHADFMTALMALFLVLWLVNATNQETRTSVAQYFNPVKLSDATLDRKGVRNPQDSEPGDGELENASEHKDPGAQSRGPERRPSAMLKDSKEKGVAPFEDPYTILAEVAAARPEPGSDSASRLTLGTTGKPGMNGGEALRDPFDPTFWRQTPPDTPIDPTKKNEGAEIITATIAASPQSPGTAGAGRTQGDATETDGTPATAPTPRAGAVPATMRAPGSAPPAPGGRPASPPPALTAALETNAETELGRAISEALTGSEPKGDGKGDGRGDPNTLRQPGVDVKATDEGLLISLTDKADFGMFAIGSAEPQAETVATMQKIAGLLAQRPGTIVIRGHTDGRPFRSRTNDNWRLSTARAHIAQDLLVRGGVQEGRIEHVEGHASRRLRNPDPEAAENRRIEILLREKRT